MKTMKKVIFIFSLLVFLFVDKSYAEDNDVCRYRKHGLFVSTTAATPELFKNLRTINFLVSTSPVDEQQLHSFLNRSSLEKLGMCLLEDNTNVPVALYERDESFSKWTEDSTDGDLLVWLRMKRAELEIDGGKLIPFVQHHVFFYRKDVNTVENLIEHCYGMNEVISDDDALLEKMTKTIRYCLSKKYQPLRLENLSSVKE